jgi:sec-independent protein translocase protein TatB
MDFLGVGAGELLVIATIALIVVGPKDLPLLLHKLGRFTARMRGMAAEFRASFDEMARQAELDELRKEIEGLKSGRISGLDEARADVESAFQAIDQDLATPGLSGMAPVAAHADEAAAEAIEDQDAPEQQPQERLA